MNWVEVVYLIYIMSNFFKVLFLYDHIFFCYIITLNRCVRNYYYNTNSAPIDAPRHRQTKTPMPQKSRKSGSAAFDRIR